VLAAQQAVLSRRRALASANDHAVRNTLAWALDELMRLRGDASR
jgi:hypothetical protein